jgi:hypothetical protein
MKLSNGALFDKCGDCKHIFDNSVDCAPFSPDNYKNPECNQMQMIDGVFPSVAPNKIHPDCRLSDVEVIDWEDEGKTSFEITGFNKRLHVNFENVEKIIIVRKAKGE